MAIQFDEVDDRFTIADHASLTLPDADWCVGIWTRVTNNAGAFFQYLLSNNGYAVNNSLNMWLKEAGAGANFDEWGFLLVDGDGTATPPTYSASAPGADSVWRLVVLQRVTASSRFELWFCEVRSAASLEATWTDAGFDAINGGTWYIGCRADTDANRFYGSEACEFFKGDFSLSQAEITALGAGIPIWGLGKSPDVYLVMGTTEATLADLFGGNNATRVSAPTTVEHPPVARPCGAAAVVAGAAAPAVGQPMELRGMVTPRIGRQWMPGLGRVGG
jgi:hypothetical protein